MKDTKKYIRDFTVYKDNKGETLLRYEDLFEWANDKIREANEIKNDFVHPQMYDLSINIFSGFRDMLTTIKTAHEPDTDEKATIH
jgi:hypothetical protein